MEVFGAGGTAVGVNVIKGGVVVGGTTAEGGVNVEGGAEPLLGIAVCVGVGTVMVAEIALKSKVACALSEAVREMSVVSKVR